jgi:excisionase family DNA binding protein
VRRRGRDAVVGGEWLTIREAQDLLGLSPSTLRRWADAGEVRTFVTPGGHRRFSRASIEALLPSRPRQRPSMTQLGETPDRMARAYRRATTKADVPWVEHMGIEDRERFRAEGIRTANALMVAMDAPEGPERRARMAEAAEACASYGRAAAEAGLAASITAETFLRFRRPFLAELAAVARRLDLDAAATTQLLDDATAALDELLIATLRGREAGVVPERVGLDPLAIAPVLEAAAAVPAGAVAPAGVEAGAAR